MSKACNCKDAQETHEHCKDCDCILNWNESEFYCRWCEERRAKEKEQEVDELEQMLDDVFYKTFGRRPLKGEELKKLQRRTYMPELDANGKFVREE